MGPLQTCYGQFPNKIPCFFVGVSKITKMVVSNQTQEQEKLGKLITNVNLMTSQLELHYFEDTDNEIVVRAREMSEMVSEMYLFTR